MIFVSLMDGYIRLNMEGIVKCAGANNRDSCIMVVLSTSNLILLFTGKQ